MRGLECFTLGRYFAKCSGPYARGCRVLTESDTFPAPPDVSRLIDSWIEDAERQSALHKSAAIRLKRWHYRLGLPSVILSAIVGTSIFAGLEQAVSSLPMRALLAGVSITAAALAAAVTFLSFSERSATHRRASQEYSEVSKRLQILRTTVSKLKSSEWRAILDGYSRQLDSIGLDVDYVHDDLHRSLFRTEFYLRVPPYHDSLEKYYALAQEYETLARTYQGRASADEDTVNQYRIDLQRIIARFSGSKTHLEVQTT